MHSSTRNGWSIHEYIRRYPSTVREHSWQSLPLDSNPEAEFFRSLFYIVVTMSRVRVPELSATQRREIKQAFDIIDTDSTGSIDVKDIKVALQALGFEPKKDEAKYIISQLEQAEKDPLRNARVVEGTFRCNYLRPISSIRTSVV
jgi:hypothetical protein